MLMNATDRQSTAITQIVRDTIRDETDADRVDVLRIELNSCGPDSNSVWLRLHTKTTSRAKLNWMRENAAQTPAAALAEDEWIYAESWQEATRLFGGEQIGCDALWRVNRDGSTQTLKQIADQHSHGTSLSQQPPSTPALIVSVDAISGSLVGDTPEDAPRFVSLDSLDGPLAAAVREREDAIAGLSALRAFARAQRELPDAVATVRAAGLPWREVGDALAISTQAAQQRFG